MYWKEKWMEMWERERERVLQYLTSNLGAERAMASPSTSSILQMSSSACCLLPAPSSTRLSDSSKRMPRMSRTHSTYCFSSWKPELGSDSPSLAFKSTKHILGYFLACADLSKTWLKRSTALNKIYTHTHACTHRHICTPMHAPIHMHSYIHIHACTHLRAYSPTCMHIHTHAWTHTQAPTTKQD